MQYPLKWRTTRDNEMAILLIKCVMFLDDIFTRIWQNHLSQQPQPHAIFNVIEFW